jgi:hypothetical protein
MNAFLTDIRKTIVPDRDSRNGPLPPLLISMTLVTGLVDAFSYLVLGHVFVANMTGNIVLLGFALAGAPGFSITASATALASFYAGALIGGRIGSRHGGHRARRGGARPARSDLLSARHRARHGRPRLRDQPCSRKVGPGMGPQRRLEDRAQPGPRRT